MKSIEAQVKDYLELSEEGEVLIIGLNRQEKRNALNDGAINALDLVFSTIPAHIKAAVLYGIGDNFSAGLDLSDLKEKDAVEGVFHSRNWHRVFEKIQFGKVPVVAALKGAVIGGGLELAASAHIRVADASTFYALPEGQRGIFVGGGGSVRIPRLVNVSIMMDMMLTGRVIKAQEGLGLGFSQYLEENSLQKAKELAKKIAGNAAMTNFAVTQVLPRISESDMSAGFMMESLVSSIAQSAPEAKARVRDFLEKRAVKIKPTEGK